MRKLLEVSLSQTRIGQLGIMVCRVCTFANAEMDTRMMYQGAAHLCSCYLPVRMAIRRGHVWLEMAPLWPL